MHSDTRNGLTHEQLENSLWERIHAMEKVLAYIGDCAGVEPGDVDGLIGWADSHRAKAVTKAPKHKRFTYRLTGQSSIRIGVIEVLEIDRVSLERFDPDERLEFGSAEAAFEATFRHGSEFIQWLDQDWVTS